MAISLEALRHKRTPSKTMPSANMAWHRTEWNKSNPSQSCFLRIYPCIIKIIAVTFLLPLIKAHSMRFCATPKRYFFLPALLLTIVGNLALANGTVTFDGGSGTQADPYQISTWAQLNGMRQNQRTAWSGHRSLWGAGRLAKNSHQAHL